MTKEPMASAATRTVASVAAMTEPASVAIAVASRPSSRLLGIPAAVAEASRYSYRPLGPAL